MSEIRFFLRGVFNYLERSSIVILCIYSWCANIIVCFLYKCFDTTYCGDKKTGFLADTISHHWICTFQNNGLSKMQQIFLLKFYKCSKKSFYFLLFQINENFEKSTKSNAYFKTKEHWWLLRIPPLPLIFKSYQIQNWTHNFLIEKPKYKTLVIKFSFNVQW